MGSASNGMLGWPFPGARKSRWPIPSGFLSKHAMPDMYLSAGAVSDTGRVRELNEDRCWFDPARGIFLVVDGIGGAAAGEFAAQIAVQTIQQTIMDRAPSERRVRQAIAAANNRIFR